MSTLNDASTILSAVLALLAFPYAVWQLRQSRKASSADLVVSLNDSLRSSWWDYVHAGTDGMKDYHMDDILSVLELIATLRSDGMFSHGSGTFISELLDDHVRLLREEGRADPSLNDRIGRLRVFGKLFVEQHHQAA